MVFFGLHINQFSFPILFIVFAVVFVGHEQVVLAAMQTSVHCTISGLNSQQCAVNGGQLVAQFYIDGNVHPDYGERLRQRVNPDTGRFELFFEALNFGIIEDETWLHKHPDSKQGMIWETLLDTVVLSECRRTDARVAMGLAPGQGAIDEGVYNWRASRGTYPPPIPSRQMALHLEIGYYSDRNENGFVFTDGQSHFFSVYCVDLSALAAATQMGNPKTVSALEHSIRNGNHHIWLDIRASHFLDFPCH